MLEALTNLTALFPNALISGIIIAVVCPLIGVFVVLKRVVFISITLSETAACGIAAAMLFNLPPLAGAFIFTAVVVTFLSAPYENSRIPRDAVLGVIFLIASALSILLVAESGFGLHEIKVMLYGDLILAGPTDRNILLATGTVTTLLFLLFIRPIFYAFLDPEGSRVMGVACRFWELFFFYLLGLVVSAASKSGGVLLVFCFLVAPPVNALLLSRNITVVLIIAPLAGVIATISGLFISYEKDWPSNQVIIIIACTLLVITWAIKNIFQWFHKKT